jgi:hypothetical protein
MTAMPIVVAKEPSSSNAVPAQLARAPKLQALWCYWRSKLAGRPVLPRADLVPHEIPELLPMLTLIERTPDGRLRYRLVGSKLVDAYGFEASGKFLDQILSPARLKVAHLHAGTALSRARPTFSRTEYVSPTGLNLVNSRLNIPLADATGALTLVLGGHMIEWSHALDAQFGDGGLVPRADVLDVL